jgi:hypothetical protein
MTLALPARRLATQPTRQSFACGADLRPSPLAQSRRPRRCRRPGDPTRYAITCDALRVLRFAVDVRGGNERREAGSCTARGTRADWMRWEPRMRRTPLRRGLEAGHGTRRDRRAVPRWLLVPCWRPQGNVFGAPAETVKTSSRPGHHARGQRHPAPSRRYGRQRACVTPQAADAPICATDDDELPLSFPAVATLLLRALAATSTACKRLSRLA